MKTMLKLVATGGFALAAVVIGVVVYATIRYYMEA